MVYIFFKEGLAHIHKVCNAAVGELQILDLAL